MPLRVRTKREIVGDCTLRVRGRQAKVSDFTAISNTRIIIEEVHGEEFASLNAGLQEDFNRWFIQTATGENLDRRLADYGVDRPPAIAGTGKVMFTAGTTVPISIPPGTVVRTQPGDGAATKRYRVIPNTAPGTDGLWVISHPSGSIEANIVALDAGLAGNTPALTIIALETSITGVSSVINQTPVIDGRPVATDDEFREYFKDYLRSLTRGTKGALLFHLLDYIDPGTNIRPVRSAALEEWGGQVLLDAGDRPVALLVHVDLVGGIGLDAIQARIDGTDVSSDPGWRAAGVPTGVRAAQRVLYDVIARIDVDKAFNSETVRRNVVDAIFSHFARLPVGGRKLSGELQGQLIFARLVSDVQAVPGVLRVVFERPTTPIFMGVGTKLDPGAINVTVSSVT